MDSRNGQNMIKYEHLMELIEEIKNETEQFKKCRPNLSSNSGKSKSKSVKTENSSKIPEISIAKTENRGKGGQLVQNQIKVQKQQNLQINSTVRDLPPPPKQNLQMKSEINSNSTAVTVRDLPPPPPEIPVANPGQSQNQNQVYTFGFRRTDQNQNIIQNPGENNSSFFGKLLVLLKYFIIFWLILFGILLIVFFFHWLLISLGIVPPGPPFFDSDYSGNSGNWIFGFGSSASHVKKHKVCKSFYQPNPGYYPIDKYCKDKIKQSFF